MEKTLIVICGWPASGKSTLARMISAVLEILWLDLDTVRKDCCGLPNPHPEESDEEMARNERETAHANAELLTRASTVLNEGQSVIISAPFSSAKRWDGVARMMEHHPGVPVKVIWCVPKNIRRNEVERRLQGRTFGVDHFGTVNSWVRYQEIKTRYQTPSRPHLVVDTGRNSPENSVKEVIEYLRQW